MSKEDVLAAIDDYKDTLILGIARIRDGWSSDDDALLNFTRSLQECYEYATVVKYLLTDVHTGASLSYVLAYEISKPEPADPAYPAWFVLGFIAEKHEKED